MKWTVLSQVLHLSCVPVKDMAIRAGGRRSNGDDARPPSYSGASPPAGLAIDVQAWVGDLSEERAWHLENGMETAMADALKWQGADRFGSEDRRCIGSRPHRPSQAKCFRLILGGPWFDLCLMLIHSLVLLFS
jgi:hypothetical protein